MSLITRHVILCVNQAPGYKASHIIADRSQSIEVTRDRPLHELFTEVIGEMIAILGEQIVTATNIFDLELFNSV